MTTYPHPPEQWLVGTSTTTLRPFSEEAIADCQKAGLQCIELTLFGGNGVTPGTPEALQVFGQRAKSIQDHGLRLWSVHLPFGRTVDISSADANILSRTVSIHEELIAAAATWGASVAVLHPSTEPIQDDERDGYLKRSKESIERLARHAAACGIKLAVEDLPRTCLGNTSTELAWLLDGIDDVWVAFDINHLLKESVADFIAKLGSRILTVHMSDYDGIDERHWVPGEGIIDWPAAVTALAAAGYPGPFIYELRPRDDGKTTPQNMVAVWRRILADIKANC